MKRLTFVFIALLVVVAALPLMATGQAEPEAESTQTECTHRGDLDSRYCDEDRDLLADTPSETVDPDVLFFAYVPVEDPAVYKDVFRPFLDHVEEATGKEVRYFSAQSYAAQVEAMRSGRLHIAGMSTGTTVFAVNLAGFIPFSIMGTEEGEFGYRLQTITHVDSDIEELEDIKGRTVAHTEEASNSGNQAPRALLPEEGIEPGEDYEVTYSGGHDSSVLGVYNQDYVAGHIASTVMERMADRGQLDLDDIRIIYESPRFPTTAFGHAHDLDPELRENIVEAFLSYDFEGTPLGEEFKDVDQFIEVSYQDAWKPIRTIQEYNGVEYTRENLGE